MAWRWGVAGAKISRKRSGQVAANRDCDASGQVPIENLRTEVAGSVADQRGEPTRVCRHPLRYDPSEDTTMIQKPFDAITWQDIEDLVANQVREGRTIEYKQILPGGKDA